MASAIKPIEYRTFDELIDAVRLDLISYQQSSDIDPAPLIKIAQAVNYELGLKIYMPKETILEIDNHRTKLPADFYQLQLALLCHNYREVSTAPWNGNVWYEQVTSQTSGSTCDICQVTHTGTCPIVVDNPYVQGKTRSICNGDINIKVLQFCAASVRCYEWFERIYIVPSRNASAFCVNTQFGGCQNKASIHGNFLETSVDCGRIYISYLGGLEDEHGNLLVLDHPTINLYYEWRLKVAVLENLYLNGEPDIERRLHYAQQQLDGYRQKALSIANAPDYRQCIRLAEVNRNMMYRRYWEPMDRWRGWLGYTNSVDVI